VKNFSNFEDNHGAGSIILNFSDAEWKDLIPSMGFRKFVCQALKTQENICQQEMRTAFWNMSKQKSSAVHSKPTVKDMPSKLPITSFFSRLEQNPVINDNTGSEDNLTTGIYSAAVPIISECKPMLSASNVEKFIAQLGRNQDGNSTLLLRRAIFEMATMIWRMREISTEQRMRSQQQSQLQLPQWKRSKLMLNHRKSVDHRQSVPVSDTAESRNQCWSENLRKAQHGSAIEISLWRSI